MNTADFGFEFGAARQHKSREQLQQEYLEQATEIFAKKSLETSMKFCETLES